MSQEENQNDNKPNAEILDKYFEYAAKGMSFIVVMVLGFLSLITFTGIAFSGSKNWWMFMAFFSSFIPMVCFAINVVKPIKNIGFLFLLLPLIPLGMKYGIQKSDEEFDKSMTEFCVKNPKDEICTKRVK